MGLNEEFGPDEGIDELLDESPDSGALSVSEPEQAVTHLAREIEQAGQEMTERALMVAGMRSGPLPSAEELIRYNESGNSLGTRLGEDHLVQRSHDRRVERAQLKLASRDMNRVDREQTIRAWALAATYFLMAALFLGGFYLMKDGHPGLGVALLSPTLLAVFGVIVQQIVGAGKADGD